MSLVFATIALRCVRGTTWRDTVMLTDADTGEAIPLTDVTEVTMRVRRTIQSAAVLMELSTTNGRLTIADAVNAELAIEVDAVDTLELPRNRDIRARYVFDTVISRAGDVVEPGFQGKLTVLPQVTRLLPEPT